MFRIIIGKPSYLEIYREESSGRWVSVIITRRGASLPGLALKCFR